MTTRQPQQTVEGEGRQTAHTHPAVVHNHDHYHVSHHHRGGLGEVLGEFEHRASWHTHEHDHMVLTHSHDYEYVDEAEYHAREAHIHDHSAPTHTSA